LLTDWVYNIVLKYINRFLAMLPSFSNKEGILEIHPATGVLSDSYSLSKDVMAQPEREFALSEKERFRGSVFRIFRHHAPKYLTLKEDHHGVDEHLLSEVTSCFSFLQHGNSTTDQLEMVLAEFRAVLSTHASLLTVSTTMALLREVKLQVQPFVDDHLLLVQALVDELAQHIPTEHLFYPQVTSLWYHLLFSTRSLTRFVLAPTPIPHIEDVPCEDAIDYCRYLAMYYMNKPYRSDYEQFYLKHREQLLGGFSAVDSRALLQELVSLVHFLPREGALIQDMLQELNTRSIEQYQVEDYPLFMKLSKELGSKHITLLEMAMTYYIGRFGEADRDEKFVIYNYFLTKDHVSDELINQLFDKYEYASNCYDLDHISMYYILRKHAEEIDDMFGYSEGYRRHVIDSMVRKVAGYYNRHAPLHFFIEGNIDKGNLYSLLLILEREDQWDEYTDEELDAFFGALHDQLLYQSAGVPINDLIDLTYALARHCNLDQELYIEMSHRLFDERHDITAERSHKVLFLYAQLRERGLVYSHIASVSSSLGANIWNAYPAYVKVELLQSSKNLLHIHRDEVVETLDGLLTHQFEELGLYHRIDVFKLLPHIRARYRDQERAILDDVLASKDTISPEETIQLLYAMIAFGEEYEQERREIWEALDSWLKHVHEQGEGHPLLSSLSKSTKNVCSIVMFNDGYPFQEHHKLIVGKRLPQSFEYMSRRNHRSPLEEHLFKDIKRVVGVIPRAIKTNAKLYGYECDFVIQTPRGILNIEADGHIYHHHRKRHEKVRKHFLREKGIEVLRIRGKDYSRDPKRELARIRSKLESMQFPFPKV